MTIYLPTHRAGEATKDGHDRIAYKDAVKEVKRQLEATGELDGAAVDEFVGRLHAVDDAPGFWEHQSDALGVFANGESVETFNLPIQLETAIVRVGQGFQLSHTAGVLGSEMRYYIFSLTQNETAFYEATRYSITPVRIHDEVPTNLAETRVVFDGGEPQHQPRPDGGAPNVVSGQGGESESRDAKLQNYYERINDGLMKLLERQREPLVVVCDEQHFADFSKALHYKNLVPKPLSVHPNALDPTSLHAATLEVVEPYFAQSAQKLSEAFEVAAGAKRIAYQADEAVPAAIGGRVDTLFVAKDMKPIYGVYREDTNSVSMHLEKQSDSVDLLELAIRATLKNDGAVASKEGDLPLEGSNLAAILRYSY